MRPYQFSFILALAAILECGQSPAFAATCQDSYNSCLNNCIPKDLSDACVGKCNKSLTACDKPKKKASGKPLPANRGETGPKPSGRPGEAFIPPKGGVVRDPGTGSGGSKRPESRPSRLDRK